MKARDMGELLLLSVLWGGSFLCIRVAAPVFGPIVLIELRVLIAGLVLLLYAALTKTSLNLRKHYLCIRFFAQCFDNNSSDCIAKS